MYTKDDFYQYYLEGKQCGEPLYTQVDLNQCGTAFYTGINGNLTGTIYPIELTRNIRTALFVSDTRHDYLHDGNGDINCPDNRFEHRCWYIEYEDYTSYRGQKVLRV